jgi:hypothetical protein
VAPNACLGCASPGDGEKAGWGGVAIEESAVMAACFSSGCDCVRPFCMKAYRFLSLSL